MPQNHNAPGKPTPWVVRRGWHILSAVWCQPRAAAGQHRRPLVTERPALPPTPLVPLRSRSSRACPPTPPSPSTAWGQWWTCAPGPTCPPPGAHQRRQLLLRPREPVSWSRLSPLAPAFVAEAPGAGPCWCGASVHASFAPCQSIPASVARPTPRHVPPPSRSYLKAIGVTSMSRAFWRGDVKREPLQRVYAITFPEPKLLKEYQHRIEEVRGQAGSRLFVMGERP